MQDRANAVEELEHFLIRPFSEHDFRTRRTGQCWFDKRTAVREDGTRTTKGLGHESLVSCRRCQGRNILPVTFEVSKQTSTSRFLHGTHFWSFHSNLCCDIQTICSAHLALAVCSRVLLMHVCEECCRIETFVSSPTLARASTRAMACVTAAEKDVKALHGGKLFEKKGGQLSHLSLICLVGSQCRALTAQFQGSRADTS